MQFDYRATSKIISYMPERIKNALLSLDKRVLYKITELRLHSGGCVGVVIAGKNYYLSGAGITKDASFSFKSDASEVENVLYNLCGGSFFVHENSLSEFYMAVDGIRVGISGRAKITDGKAVGISDIFGLCIRIPHHIENASKNLYDILLSSGFHNSCGVLIVSKPGVGKTTLLRDLALKLSSGEKPFRVCVIDERCEIYDKDLFSLSHCDFLQCVDKINGIETASRLLSPEIIICDEISCPEEAEKIARIKSRGIIFICSFHADSAANALGKDYIKIMFKEKVFDSVYELSRDGQAVLGKYTRYGND